MYSDLDLLVMSGQPIKLAALARLNDALDESDLPIHVDIVDRAACSESFGRIVDASSVPFWLRDENIQGNRTL